VSICRSWWPKDSSPWGSNGTKPFPKRVEGCRRKKESAEVITDDIKDLDWVVDRVRFMKAGIHHM